jgi:hypothetical protein
MPKSVATAGEVKIGSLRLQADRKADEIHVHDDDLRFKFKGVRKFQLAFEDFKSSAPHLKDGSVVVFPGDSSDPGSKRSACDMVMRLSKGKWTVGLNKCGTMPGIVFGDEVLFQLDEFVQRA